MFKSVKVMKDKKSLRYCLEKLENGGNRRRHNDKMQYGSWTGSLIRKRTFVKTGEIKIYSAV